ncbi:VapE domain-containing protein [Qipengyuania nanhaisediminis]|uniref:Virulence-associated protein E n=1 Tax=Qipengyuania nanhaisediminis TaxID=604088 RepID=A0A1I5KAD6_9SPHN|nr:VapE domain-containing protein [Qipengyuania nanhaisediminis]SFO81703.1 Virulence-associated protein E [Qipengyuania nanhaisediminis]
MSSQNKHAERAGELAELKPKATAAAKRQSFPDQPLHPNGHVPTTLANFRHLLTEADISVRFNLIKKRAEVEYPGLVTKKQNRDEVVLTYLQSLLIKNGLSTGQTSAYLLAVADSQPFDPFADWVLSKPWDGTSRLAAIAGTIVPVDHYDLAFQQVLVTKWLLSIVAATFAGNGFRARGVLTLQGAQGLGKTSWIASLISPPKLRDDIVKLGHSWDGGRKDARLTALRHRIVELGELEGSFRKDIASLKAFITETTDKIRPPYGRVEAEYPRTTIFAASVNDEQFLLDSTGNSRFWTIPAAGIDYQHNIDMQQVFAELKVKLDSGAQWWLTSNEERQLEEVNRKHRVISAIEAKIEEALDLDRKDKPNLPRMTATEVLKALGFSRPTNPQCKEANVALRGLLGKSKRSGGYNRWPIPWRDEFATTIREGGETYATVDDDDLY